MSHSEEVNKIVTSLDVREITEKLVKVWRWKEEMISESDVTDSEFVQQPMSDYDTEKEKEEIETQREQQRVAKDEERQRKWAILRSAEDRRNVLVASRKIHTRPTQLTFQQLKEANKEGYISDHVNVAYESPEKLKNTESVHFLSDDGDDDSSPAKTPEPKKLRIQRRSRFVSGKMRKVLVEVSRAASSPNVSPMKVDFGKTPNNSPIPSRSQVSMGVLTDCKAYRRNLNL